MTDNTTPSFEQLAYAAGDRHHSARRRAGTSTAIGVGSLIGAKGIADLAPGIPQGVQPWVYLGAFCVGLLGAANLGVAVTQGLEAVHQSVTSQTAIMLEAQSRAAAAPPQQ